MSPTVLVDASAYDHFGLSQCELHFLKIKCVGNRNLEILKTER